MMPPVNIDQYSEIANFHGIPNIPDDPDLAIEAGRRLCEALLEPLYRTFGGIAIRHLPYSGLEFYPKLAAFNITWHERPKRKIYSYAQPQKGYLTKPGMANHGGDHAEYYPGFPGICGEGRASIS